MIDVLFKLTRNATQISISESYILNSFSTDKCLARRMHVFGCSHDSISIKWVISLYLEGKKK